ncbi:MAG: trehalose-phosphatase, partial [Vicinamibacterales bacterium]
LRVVEARRVLELRPPGGGDKGDAVAGIIRSEGLQAALVAGDDGTDLAMFAAAKATASLCCRIGITSAEAPVELAAAADLMVAGPRALAALLAELAFANPGEVA